MSKIKRSMGSHVFDVCNHIFLFLLMIAMMYPLVHVLSLSLSSKNLIDAGMVTWFPRGFNIGNISRLRKKS